MSQRHIVFGGEENFINFVISNVTLEAVFMRFGLLADDFYRISLN